MYNPRAHRAVQGRIQSRDRRTPTEETGPPPVFPTPFVETSERRTSMSDECSHLDTIRDVVPSAKGCEECLKIGSRWVHLRLCRTCGHVACCDSSPHRHATAHLRATGHPIIEGYDPPEGWGWCYVDEVTLDLSDRMTPQRGPIPRFV